MGGFYFGCAFKPLEREARPEPQRNTDPSSPAPPRFKGEAKKRPQEDTPIQGVFKRATLINQEPTHFCPRGGGPKNVDPGFGRQVHVSPDDLSYESSMRAAANAEQWEVSVHLLAEMRQA